MGRFFIFARNHRVCHGRFARGSISALCPNSTPVAASDKNLLFAASLRLYNSRKFERQKIAALDGDSPIASAPNLPSITQEMT